MSCPNVINLHITEKCNFACKYCFAIFKSEKELNFDGWKKVVDNIGKYFVLNKIKNPRINLAGGEPLIVEFIDDLIDYISNKNIEVSLITNGYYLDKEFIKNNIGKICMIGVSVDSLNVATNIKIGRCTRNKRVVDIEKLRDALDYARQNGIMIKTNTVINQYNLHENLIDIISVIGSERTKILQMRLLKNVNESAIKMSVTNNEFINYISKQKFKSNYIVETSGDMQNAYVIINPSGELVSNDSNMQTVVGNCVKDNFVKLIEAYQFDEEKFENRYKKFPA